MLSQILKEFGLSEKESNVYLSCLELGHAPVSSIARNINENRVTTYSILRNLVKIGIAQTIIKNKSTYYSVISPDKLLKMRETKCENLKAKLPEFMAIAHKFDNKPQVKFFEGLEGLKQLYEDMLSSNTEPIHAFLGIGSASQNLLNYLNLHFLPERIKIGLHAKVLLCNEEKKKDYPAYTSSRKFLTEHKVLSFDFVKLYNEINIYGNDKISLVMFSEDEMSGLIIQSKKLHDTLKGIFDLARFVADQKCFQQKKETKQKSSLQKKEKKSSKKSSPKKK
ncbi:MAG: helix-turn-helix domain-containing protein [Candidatus Absconditicoccaceae bacterium]